MSEELFSTQDLNQPLEPIIASENSQEESENIENTDDPNNLEEIDNNDELNGEEMEGIDENDTEATESEL